MADKAFDDVIEIPGWAAEDPPGKAYLRHPDLIRERHRRPLKVRIARLSPSRLKQIIEAQSNTVEGLETEIELTEREAEILMGFTDAVIVAVVDSWTLPQPLPANADECQDLPGHLYDALAEKTAKLGAMILSGAGTAVETDPETGETAVVDQFSVAAVEDPGSPTGASAV